MKLSYTRKMRKVVCARGVDKLRLLRGYLRPFSSPFSVERAGMMRAGYADYGLRGLDGERSKEEM